MCKGDTSNTFITSVLLAPQELQKSLCSVTHPSTHQSIHPPTHPTFSDFLLFLLQFGQQRRRDHLGPCRKYSKFKAIKLLLAPQELQKSPHSVIHPSLHLFQIVLLILLQFCQIQRRDYLGPMQELVPRDLSLSLGARGGQVISDLCRSQSLGTTLCLQELNCTIIPVQSTNTN